MSQRSSRIRRCRIYNSRRCRVFQLTSFRGSHLRYILLPANWWDFPGGCWNSRCALDIPAPRDYIRIPEPGGGNFVAIPQGDSYTDISVRPIDDSIVEGAESIIFTLESDAAYTVGSPSSATVIISDNDGLMCDFCGVNFGPPDGYVDVWDLMEFANHWHEGVKPWK